MEATVGAETTVPMCMRGEEKDKYDVIVTPSLFQDNPCSQEVDPGHCNAGRGLRLRAGEEAQTALIFWKQMLFWSMGTIRDIYLLKSNKYKIYKY